MELPPFPPVLGSSSSSSSNQNVFPNHDDMVMLNLQNPDSGLPELPPVDPSLCNFLITPQSLDVNDYQYNLSLSDDHNSGLLELPQVDPNLGDFSYSYDSCNDPYFWNNVNVNVNDNYEPAIGNVGGNLDTCSSLSSDNFGVDNIFQFPMSIWPFPVSVDMCSSCNVLREFNHVKGKMFQYLELHGQIGIISHAILDRFNCDDISSENHNPLMFNFFSVDLDTVDKFLLNYLDTCKKEGYEIHQDELASFYQTVTVGLDESELFDSDSFLLQTFSPLASGQQDSGTDEVRLAGNDKGKEIVVASQTKSGNKRNRTGEGRRSFLAAQRQRTGKLSFNDFSEYLDLPMNEVAKLMKVCPTVIKKKCRLAGLSRWPYRKIKGLKRRILNKKEELENCTFNEQPDLQAEIQLLEEELTDVIRRCSNCTGGST